MFFFFFSSRRRHTRLQGDWSSDVCSSDLVEDLRARLDDARQEVVRALAKLQTVASRAEAASAMAEAEIALQALRAATGGPPGGSSDVAQAGTLVQQASGEFAKQNYGGALYLANQAKSVAGS